MEYIPPHALSKAMLLRYSVEMMQEVAQALAYGALFWLVYSGVLFLIVLFERDEGGRTPSSQTPPLRRSRLPFVSILIPAYNEEATIAATLEAALAQTYPASRFEVIVIDDGSTDQTAAIAQRYAERHPQRIRVIQKPNGGKHTALNAGLAMARGTYIATLDADSQPEPDALAHLVAAMETSPQAGAATPAMVVRSPHTLLQHLQSAEYLVSVALRRAYALLDAQYVTPGPFSLFRRAALDAVGPYRSAHNTEDLEMALRLQRNGWLILNVPEARVHTTVPASLRPLLRQRVRWSYGFLRNVVDYRDLLSSRYGHLGVFVLPNMLVGLAGALYAFGYFASHLFQSIVEWGVRIWYSGWSWGIAKLDWFFVPLNELTGLSLTTIAVAILLFLQGKRLARASVSPVGLLSYLFLYGFIAPLWLARALWRVCVVRSPTSWQKERSVARY